jgi:hypothetical protein
VAQAGSRGFVPSADGFAFANAWPAAPAVTVPLLVGSAGIGNAARGLCGGMVFAALDYWHAGVEPPARQPAAGTPLYRFIVRRLIDSWHLPSGVARYYRWMLRPDGDSAGAWRRVTGSRHGVARRTISREWPAIRASLDRRVPAALGVVTVASANPLRLGANHQVLACGYSVAGTVVTLRVYDPNVGPDDDVRIRFDTAGDGPASTAGLAGPASTAGPDTAFAHNLGLRLPVRGFFLTRYAPRRPPAAVTSRPRRGRRAAGTPSG